MLAEHVQQQTRQPVDAAAFRRGLGAFATGVTIVTTRCTEDFYGMTATAVSSVSLVPPLILVCVQRGGQGEREILNSGRFAVNILRADQEDLSARFASRDRPRGGDALRGVPHRLTESGCPALVGVAGYLDCALVAAHDAGDHMILVAEVCDLAVEPDAPPLLFHAGRYRRLA